MLKLPEKVEPGDTFFRVSHIQNQGRSIVGEVTVDRTTKTLIITHGGGRWNRETGIYFGLCDDQIIPITKASKDQYKHDRLVDNTLHLLFKIDAWAHGANACIGGEGGFVDEPDLVKPVHKRLKDIWALISAGPMPE